jgi:neural Wiskott-Aldrich syndrome protein
MDGGGQERLDAALAGADAVGCAARVRWRCRLEFLLETFGDVQVNVAIADFSQIPMSQNLAATLARASDFAGASGSADVGLEHVLLALCDDPDADAVLFASRVDVQRLKSETVGYLGSVPPQYTGGALGVSPSLSRILEAAAAAARGGRRRDINGAIVLAAIVGDGKSAAAQILQAQGLTFDEAIRALQAALTAPARESIPDFRPADDVLARARERVQSRSAPSLRDIMNDLPRPAVPPPPPVQMLPPPGQQTEQPRIFNEIVLLPAPVQDRVEEIPASTPEAEVPALEPESISEVAPPTHPAEFDQPASRSFPPEHGEHPQPVPGYVYPSEQPAPLSAAPPGPPLFDFARPVPIATPPPIPPPIPQSGFQPEFQLGGPPSSGFGTNPGFGRASMPLPQSAPSSMQPPRWEDFGQAHPGLGYTPSPPPFGAGDAYGRQGQQSPPMAPSPSPAPSMPLPSPAARGGAEQKLNQPGTGRAKAETGQLAENIPRGMRVGKSERVEVRIAKVTAKAITEGLEGGGVAWQHELTVTQAMSVRLRAPDGGFFIETVSPETQWIENQLGFDSDDFASWRFLVTPQSRGWSRLQIIVSARTIGADGMAAETALPDQVVDVKVRTNYQRTFLRWVGWIIAAVAGGALAKFGEGSLDVAHALVQKFMH